MIFKISWRNIWRSPLRSLVVMGSIMVGTWAIIALLSFSFGMVKSYVNNAIEIETSHLQIHNPVFKEDQEVKALLPDAESKLAAILQDERVDKAALRTLVSAMLVAPKGTRGVMAKGVDEKRESELTNLGRHVVEGDYFSPDGRNQVLMGKELAEKLGLGLRKKIVLQFQGLDGEITAGAFRIVGLIKTGNKMRDDANVFVHRRDLNRLIGDGKAAHELAIYVKNTDELESIKETLKVNYSQDLVESYQELSPDIKLYETQIGSSYAVIVGIFMLALIFGIINTMLMAVLERTRELGVLMSVGMNKFRVFSMIVIETLLLGFMSALAGLFLGWLTVRGFSDAGLDLSSFSKGLELVGMSTVVYPFLENSMYMQLAIAVVITSLLASLYPAYKAISLRPVEALRKI